MIGDNENKEVYFYEYCSECKYKDVDGTNDPCDDCLSHPFNTDSHKPVRFKEK